MNQRPALLGGWLLGVATGVLLLTLVQAILQRGGRQDTTRYQLVSSYARDAFVRQVDDEELLDAALTGMLESLDPYSRFYPPVEAVQLERETGGRYKGIGALFRRLGTRRHVLFTLPNSPARLAGLTVGDGVLTIDGEDPSGWEDERFREALAPQSGEPVTLELIDPSGMERELQVDAAGLIDPSLRHVRMISDTPPIAWISVHSFSRETHGELVIALTHLEEETPLAGLVLDLRDNRGGVLQAAVDIARMFISEGVIVETRGNGTKRVERALADQVSHPDLPLVILVNRSSASASEVLASALQDHRRAVLVGEGTYGKGVVQTIRRFEPWGARAKVTSAYYYSPSGRNFERTIGEDSTFGIQPDVALVVPAGERQGISNYLGSHYPDSREEALISAWEADLGIELLPSAPVDSALETALDILLGNELAVEN
ncbi:MAG: hypothetical protein CMJ86_08805 [Planctomycetes bacterium]|nr:hypothetical protein [Planctomycetota bacterium]